MGAKLSTSISDIPLTSEQLNKLMKDTGFSSSHLKMLYARFRHLDRDSKGFLIKDDLLCIPEVHFNPFGERIAGSFFKPKYFPDGTMDEAASNRLFFYDFVSHFAVFRPVTQKSIKNNEPCSRQHKTRFLFDLIDTEKAGHFTRAELLEIIELMIGQSVDEDQLQSMVDRIFNEADANTNGYVTYDEFENAISNLDIEPKMAFIGFQ